MQLRPTAVSSDTSSAVRWSLPSLMCFLTLLFASCHVDDVAVRECNDGDIDFVLCEGGQRIVERHCDNERWVPNTVDCTGKTLPRYACEEGRVETLFCEDAHNGHTHGVYERRCEHGEWVNSRCEAIEECEPDDSLTVVCPNGEEQEHSCVERQWSPRIECTSQCLHDAIKEETCGLNLRGDETRACVDEQWAGDWICDDPDECTDDATDTIPCQGWAGRNPTTCIEGQWVPSTCEHTELTGAVSDPDAPRRGFCVLDANGEALCWGSNAEGQLGAGHRNPAPTIRRVTGGHSFTSIARGPNHACGITHAGALYCWGSNAHGQLARTGEAAQPTPQKVEALADVNSVAVGPRNTCIIDSNQHLYCWGSNEQGQLADEGAPQTNTPQRISGLESVQHVAISYGTICAVGANKQLYCWGDNRTSQASNLPNDIEHTPVSIYNMDLVTDVALAHEHVCAIRKGDVYCWGDNSQGQIGNGSTNAATLPAHVPLPQKAHHIDVGRRLSCAVTVEDELYCWGANIWGEMGVDNATTSYASPQHVATVDDVATVAISSGPNDYLGHTLCVATHTGEVACWSRNLDHSIPGADIEVHTVDPVYLTLN